MKPGGETAPEGIWVRLDAWAYMPGQLAVRDSKGIVERTSVPRETGGGSPGIREGNLAKNRQIEGIGPGHSRSNVMGTVAFLESEE